MKHPVDKLFRFNLFTLLFWLLSATTFAGSPEIGASPGCKAAVGLANLAAADVKEAFKSLDQAMDKTDRALKKNKSVAEKFKKEIEAKDSKSFSKFPKNDEKDKAFKTLKESQSNEQSAQNSLKEKMRVYRKRVAESFKRCGRPE